MQIAGYSPYTGQSVEPTTVVQNNQLEGRQTQALSQSETQNTVTASESTSLSNAAVVNQANESESTPFEAQNRGNNVDITV
jgi:hypothetical protein